MNGYQGYGLRVLPILAWSVLLPRCGATSESPGPVCVLGDTRVCFGPKACTGSQTCATDRQGWTPCDCGSLLDSGAATDAAGDADRFVSSDAGKVVASPDASAAGATDAAVRGEPDGSPEDAEIDPRASAADAGDARIDTPDRSIPPLPDASLPDAPRPTDAPGTSTCAVPQSLACTTTNGRCSYRIPATFRDFDPSSHPDFEPPTTNGSAITGLVLSDLDLDGKPVWSGLNVGYIHSVESFSQWYRTTPGINAATEAYLTLWDNGAGGLVNRWTDAGEPWTIQMDISECSRSDCSEPTCAPFDSMTCMAPCVIDGTQQSGACMYLPVALDGTPLFFPIDHSPNVLGGERYPAVIAPPYGNWQDEPGTPLHNFHFTSEAQVLFKYDAHAKARLEVMGDDDIWVFINNKLALDVGGYHRPSEASLVIDSTTGPRYGLEEGGLYRVAIFHAERQRSGSTLRLSFAGFDLYTDRCQEHDDVVTNDAGTTSLGAGGSGGQGGGRPADAGGSEDLDATARLPGACRPSYTLLVGSGEMPRVDPLGPGPLCIAVKYALGNAYFGCSETVDERHLTVNGVAAKCGSELGQPLSDGYYYFHIDPMVIPDARLSPYLGEMHFFGG